MDSDRTKIEDNIEDSSLLSSGYAMKNIFEVNPAGSSDEKSQNYLE
jgi:hypothetical protein